MFGNNPARKIEIHSTTGTLAVQEVFHTIQGEGPLAGKAAIFVRLAGCHLKCHFCFVGSTMVSMYPCGSKRIDEIEVGDMVVAYLNGEWVPRKVTRTMVSESKESLLRIDHGSNTPTFCTPDHPFYVRGKGWTYAHELEEGDVLVHFSNAAKRTMWNPMRDVPGVAELAASGRDYSVAGQRLKAKWKEPKFRADNVKRMQDQNPMKDPAVAIKAWVNRDHKITRPEALLMKICEGLPIEHVSGGELVVDNLAPDFVVTGELKLIEVWAADAQHAKFRTAEWMDKRGARFKAQGYDTLFIEMPASGVKNGDFAAIRQLVADFCYNGEEVLSVKEVPPGSKGWVRLAGAAESVMKVYNLEVEGVHNYVANNVVVHNCDTEFESNINNVMPWPDLAEKVNFLLGDHPNTDLVVLTGGEPLRQRIGPLVIDMLGIGVTVQLETAGNLWDPSLDCEEVMSAHRTGRFVIVTSPKTQHVHPRVSDLCRHFKYIVTAEEVGVDGLPSMSTQSHNVGKPVMIFRTKDPLDTIWVSPCDSHDPVKNAANMKEAVNSCLVHGYRLSLQMHKVASEVMGEVLP